MMNKLNFKNTIIFFLFLLILSLLIRVLYLRNNYFKKIDNGLIFQEVDGIKYKTVQSEDTSYEVIIGDIIGIDKKSYDFVDSLAINKKNPVLAIPGINKNFSKITKDNFLYLIANKNNVFIPDNFCIEDWPSKLNQDMYDNSNLSRGSFCGSEEEVEIIDKLIKQYNASKIKIYYSVETYRELLQGFLLYLDGLSIGYELIKI